MASAVNKNIIILTMLQHCRIYLLRGPGAKMTCWAPENPILLFLSVHFSIQYII